MLLRVLRVMFPGCGLLARALQSCLIRMKTVALIFHAAGSLKTVKSFKGVIRRKSCAGRQNRKLNARALIPDDLVIVESDPEKIDTLAVK